MNEQQLRFVKELAKYLTANETLRSVELQLGKAESKQWAALRNVTPLSGYYDGEEGRKRAEDELVRFLFHGD